jgi:glyoxylase-like metal-dependent hydrolase (beta-lactamase superfamily II)
MNPSVRCFALRSLFALAALAPAGSRAADAPPAVEPVAVAAHIYTFTSTMSVSAALVGDEGVLLIDSGDKPEVAASVQTALAKLTAKPVRLLVNTHWHFDHVNGNETFGALGSTIIGHDRMRERMAAGKTTAVGPGFPTIAFEREALALPSVTFDRELTLHFAGEEVLLVHPAVGQAHTDGDVVVYFKHANVVHLGDLYFQGLYPYIDVGSGGWTGGIIAACREVLARIDDKTIVIPGHGPVSHKAQLEAYVAMLSDISGKVTALIKAGKTLDEVKAAKPTAAYDEGWGKVFLKPDQFTELVYNGIVAHSRK